MNGRATAAIIGNSLLGGLLAIAAVARADTYGRQERARITGPVNSIEVVARLDGGVTQSSLHAVGVKYFNRGGTTWVRFTIDNGSVLPGNRVTLEREVLKDVKLKQRGGGIEHRPLVRLGYCIGRMAMDSEVSVTDRSGYTAPLVIGAADLQKLGSVDSAREYTREPDCADQPPVAAPAAAVSAPAPARRSRLSELLPSDAPPVTPAPPAASRFSCDGRQHCSQMSSRAEAEFFVRNCPNTKMDGDHDGIPCENDSRW